MATNATVRSAAPTPTSAAGEGVRDLFDELHQLLGQPMDADRFYAEATRRACEALGGANMAVWQAAGGGPSLICQYGLEHDTLFRSEPARQQHLRLLSETFADGRFRSSPLTAGAPDSANSGSANYAIYLQPVLVEGEVAATIQLVRNETGQRAAEIPAVLAAIAALAGSFHYLQELGGKRRTSQWVTHFEGFIRAIHGSLAPTDIAYALANSGPALLDCDRVVVLARRGQNYRVTAVSGQTSINPRADAVRSAERLIKSIPAGQAVIRYPDDAAQFDAQEALRFESYLDETHAKSVAVGFLAGETGGVDEEVVERTIEGGFIAEKYDGALLPDGTGRAELIVRHAGQALHNANAHSRIFMLPVWSALGNWLYGVRTRVSRTALVLGAIAAGVLALVLVPADFELTARGALQPKLRQHVFAKGDGTIADLLVAEGQLVAADDVLARMENPALDLEMEKLLGEVRTTHEKLAAVKSSRFAEAGNRVDAAARAELAAQEEELREWLASLARQQELVEKQREDLEVRSPLLGNVITWNLDPTLRDRPVQRGQLLMTVADLKGAWELELMLPDRSVGHLLAAQEKHGEKLPVEFTLATNPHERINGRVRELAPSIQLDQREGAGLVVAVEFDQKSLEFMQPGATVTAKIHCGKRSLGYVWLHDLWEFLQYRVLFYF